MNAEILPCVNILVPPKTMTYNSRCEGQIFVVGCCLSLLEMPK